MVRCKGDWLTVMSLCIHWNVIRLKIEALYSGQTWRSKGGGGGCLRDFRGFSRDIQLLRVVESFSGRFSSSMTWGWRSHDRKPRNALPRAEGRSGLARKSGFGPGTGDNEMPVSRKFLTHRKDASQQNTTMNYFKTPEGKSSAFLPVDCKAA